MTFADYLTGHSSPDWAIAFETVSPEMHPIDRDAARVWFAFFSNGPAPEKIEASHAFLYSHRYWPQVKRAILSAAKEPSWPPLPDTMRQIADHATRTTQVDRDQLLGVVAASLLTLRHVGLEAFTAASGAVQLPQWAHVRSIRQVHRARRHRGIGRALLGLLNGHRHRMTYSEAQPGASFVIKDNAAIASGFPSNMQRCGSTCSGRCVIGVLSGSQELSQISAEEDAKLNAIGCPRPQSSHGHALIRLACYARAAGDVSFVMKPERPN